MEIPKRLSHKIALFQQSGRLFRDPDDLFTEAAWQQVLVGQGIKATDNHPLAQQLSTAQRQELFSSLKQIYQNLVTELPDHQTFLQRYLS